MRQYVLIVLLGGQGSLGGSSAGAFGPGQHPVDDLIRTLIAQPQRPVTSQEIAQIQQQLATAPFNPAVIRVPRAYRARRYQRRVLGPRTTSLRWHVVQRVFIDRQWAPKTTGMRFLTDLRAAVRSNQSRLGVYVRRGEHVAVVLAPNTLPRSHLGSRAETQIFVVYSADRSHITTGYQTAGVQYLSIPGDVRWLT